MFNIQLKNVMLMLDILKIGLNYKIYARYYSIHLIFVFLIIYLIQMRFYIL